jgi:hypothetical protein
MLINKQMKNIESEEKHMNPDVYTVKDIMVKLKIRKNTAYDFIKEGHFPVIEIKGRFRIPVKHFDDWMNNLNKPA